MKKGFLIFASALLISAFSAIAFTSSVLFIIQCFYGSCMKYCERKYIIENNTKQVKDEKNVIFLEKLINRAPI